MSKTSATLPLSEPPSRSPKAAEKAAAAYIRRNCTAATWRAYKLDWQTFATWCKSVDRSALPAIPQTVALFLATRAKRDAPGTLHRRCAAIRLMHLGAKLLSPTDAREVGRVLRRIRSARKQPPRQKAPAVDADVQRMADAIEPQTRRGLRDRALVLLGFAGALAPSDLVAFDVEHLKHGPKGLILEIPSSTTDQDPKGQTIAIPSVPDSKYCPRQAVLDWLMVADISTGALFRRMYRGDAIGVTRLTAPSVALVVKRLALLAGLDPVRYAGLSLRTGFLTSAARIRANIFKMAEQSRHKSLNPLRDYVRDAEQFENQAAADLLQTSLSKDT